MAINISHIKAFYKLTKPGIIRGNVMLAAAAYFFGAAGSINLTSFVGLLAGLTSIIASACVYNNIMDRNIDAKMSRTKNRGLVSGEISAISAFVFATILLVAGILLLAYLTNFLTLLIALIGHIAYVLLYGWGKRKTVHGTLIGTISGSTPPVIGYVAASNTLDINAVLLFVVLVAWQMPHFYAIALFRLQDYKRAGIPVLPAVHGSRVTRQHILVYIGLFIISVILLGTLGDLSLVGTLVLVLCGMYWFYVALKAGVPDSVELQDRRQFRVSLIVLLILSVLLGLNSFLI